MAAPEKDYTPPDAHSFPPSPFGKCDNCIQACEKLNSNLSDADYLCVRGVREVVESRAVIGPLGEARKRRIPPLKLWRAANIEIPEENSQT